MNHRALLILVLTFSGWTLPFTAGSATLTDFGYETKKVSASDKTLVILARFGNMAFENFDAPVIWDSYVFNENRLPFGNASFFKENSNNRFQFDEVDILRFNFDATNRFAAIQQRMPAGTASTEVNKVYISNIVQRAMAPGVVDFSAFDANGNGTVNQEELLILIVQNDQGRGRVRYSGTIQPSGSSVAFNGKVALMIDTVDDETFVHEVAHLWEALDIYGPWGTDQDLNQNVTLMSSGLIHIDPWHKMQFGWIEPRIRTFLTTGGPVGGTATLTAPQLMQPDGAIILYHPSRGTDEYFMLEYRTPNSSASDTFEVDLPGSGMVLWHVMQDAQKRPRQWGDAVFPNSEQGWRECTFCRCLMTVGTASDPCPSTNATHQVGTRHYRVIKDMPTDMGQHGWRQCSKCGGMSYYPLEAQSSCPAGGRHDGASSGRYSLRLNSPERVGVDDWRRCFKCQILYFGDRQDTSVCPADNLTHETDANKYTLITSSSHYTMMSRSGPINELGRGGVWESGSVTPPLTWYNGESSHFRIRVRPFSPGANTITIDWEPISDIWVDYRYVGLLENGDFKTPFNTLLEGHLSAFPNNTIFIKTRGGDESVRLNKRVRIEAFGGPVKIGK